MYKYDLSLPVTELYSLVTEMRHRLRGCPSLFVQPPSVLDFGVGAGGRGLGLFAHDGDAQPTVHGANCHEENKASNQSTNPGASHQA